MSITASCGCVLAADDEGEAVIYSSESCAAVEGFRPSVTHAWFCTPCAQKARSWPEYLSSGGPAREEDYYPSHEALHDLVALISERDVLNGGGPDWSKRWRAALLRAEEILRDDA